MMDEVGLRYCDALGSQGTASLSFNRISGALTYVQTDPKVHLYRTNILPALLYGCETWTVIKTLEKSLYAFDT